MYDLLYHGSGWQVSPPAFMIPSPGDLRTLLHIVQSLRMQVILVIASPCVWDCGDDLIAWRVAMVVFDRRDGSHQGASGKGGTFLYLHGCHVGKITDGRIDALAPILRKVTAELSGCYRHRHHPL